MNEPKNYGAVMLSSTFTNLKEHRQRAIEVIQKLGYFPRVMEFSGAQAGADVIDTSLQMVRDAVAYVGVVSLKYGQTPVDPARNPDKLSVTELEFNEATRLGRPIVLFIMGDEHPGKKGDFESDPDKLEKLNKFRERAKRMREGSEVERIYETFDSLEQFSTAAATAISNLVRFIERAAPLNASSAAPEALRVISNIPINVPFHFVGRGDELVAIENVLNKNDGRAAIAVLHGLRGVGKTTLAATYAVRHRDKYRATWWIKAETEATMRADLVGLGIQLGWIAADAPEEKSVEAVLDRLGSEGESILLVYDNAIGPKELVKFLPRGTGSRAIVTSNAPNWGAVATSVEIEVWPKETGADFLMARTGRATERDVAIALSEVLGGLPLAHEQAAAYCERIGVSLAEYKKRLEATPAMLLDSASDAVDDYHGGLTVAKTFALAMKEASKRHRAAEALIIYAALLAPEPIPLFLFSEGREIFSESFASDISDNGLDEAVAALLAFALVDRESIADERDGMITTDCIRLHRLVRQVAAAQIGVAAQARARGELVRAMAEVYPLDVFKNPTVWPVARRLDAIALALIEAGNAFDESRETASATTLVHLGVGGYRYGPLADFAGARPYFDRALAMSETAFGHEHRNSAAILNNIGRILESQGDLAQAQSYYERALIIQEKALGLEHPETATTLSNLGSLLEQQGDLASARTNYERVLAIDEKVLGANHRETAADLNNLGYVLRRQGHLEEAQQRYERALAIYEQSLGPTHPELARVLNNLGSLLETRGNYPAALRYYERSLAIREGAWGAEHPVTAVCLNNLGLLRHRQGDLVGARPYFERALAIYEQTLGPKHSDTKLCAGNSVGLLDDLGAIEEAAAIRQKFGLKDDDV